MATINLVFGLIENLQNFVDIITLRLYVYYIPFLW